MNKYIFLLIIFYNNFSLAQEIKNDTIKIKDSTITLDSIKTITEEVNKNIFFELIDIKVNNIQFITNEISSYKNNIEINERDTLSLIIQLKGGINDIIFNYYFNGDPNFRTIENGKILYDKISNRIYFDFIPNNEQASNKFLTWNLFAYENNFLFSQFNFLIEINNLEYAPIIINKQINKIIRDSYNFKYTPIIMDGDQNTLFSLKTNAPIDEFDPISGTILWKINPNNIDELEKTYNFELKVFKQNNPEKYDLDTFKIIYSENNFAPVFGKTSKWIVEEGENYEYKIPVDDPNVNDSLTIENIGSQLPRGMKLNSKNKTLIFDVDYNHVDRVNNTQNYSLELKASDLSGLSSQISLDVVVLNTINPMKVQEKITELLKELKNQEKGLDEINDNLKWIESTSKNNRKIRTFTAAGITFLGAVVGVIAGNLDGSKKAVRLAGPIIGASGAVISVINEVLSRDDNEIKTLLQETIKLQSNVKAKYDRLSFYENSSNNSNFQNQEIGLLIRTIENDRESLNKNLFTISENYQIIISENRIKNILMKK